MKILLRKSSPFHGYLLTVSLFILQVLYAESTAEWIISGPGHSEGNVVSCRSGEQTDFKKLEGCKAIWTNGEGVSSGEHYWKVYFDKLDNYGLVGITSNDNVTEELYYGGTTSFGKRIHRGDTIGILASFSNGNLKLYFAHNSHSPEVFMEVDTDRYKGIYPVVSFVGAGRAIITKETTIPSVSHRRCTTQTRNFLGIEGNWRIANPESIKISGHPFKFYTHGAEERLKSHNGGSLATLNMRPTKVAGQYDARLTIVNRIWFKVKDCDGSWSSTTPETTQVGVTFELEDLEDRMTALLENPDSFTISGAQMTLRKGNMIVRFVR